MKNYRQKFPLFLIAFVFFSLAIFSAQTAAAKNIQEYNLTIKNEAINIAAINAKKITVNGSIPAPILHFKEGDEAVIHVENKMNSPTAIHWHGLILPGEMDGVPGFNGFPGIKSGETFTYRFPIKQSGTYWYHAHEMGQEQDGLYGAIVIAPQHESIKAQRDYVILLSDFHQEDSSEIMKNLKISSDYYAISRRTISDFFAEVKNSGLRTAWQKNKDWNQMRMAKTDLSDVTGYKFLINGKSVDENWTGIFSPGEKIRLRFINASAMSFFDLRIPGLKMNVVQADGQNIEPVTVDEFRFAPAETYDVILTPENQVHSIIAESLDRSGFAIATLATKPGLRGEIPQPRPRTNLTMADMPMENMKEMDHANMNDHDMESGWAETNKPKNHKALAYSDLRYAGVQQDQRQPSRNIDVRLGGNMQRYIWTINGKKFSESKPINLEYGERVRLTFTNETMMAHPMHLHGMFVQLENGQAAAKLPNKHTVIIPPAGSYSVLITADQPGEWAFHCHLLYHMMSGMMQKLVVAKLDSAPEKSSTKSARETHAH
jgi:FtsP/CotA-like multicopper oxidase with cupredoxin domain